MKSLLLVIDLQKEFINEHTLHLPEKIEKLINSDNFDDVAFARFINYEDSVFVKKLDWRGCLQEADKEIVIDTKNSRIFDKSIYSAVNEEFINYIDKNHIKKIYLCGIDTECCVLKTAFDLFELNYDVYVLKDYCACIHGIERHNCALQILKSNIGESSIL